MQNAILGHLKSKLFYHCLVLCILMLTTVAACSAPESPMSASKPASTSPSTGAIKYGGTLRIASQLDGGDIGYPPKIIRGDSLRLVVPCVETLLRTDATGQLVPWLATDYKLDAAAKSITLSIRKGVKFHDGTDLNAEAVKWNLDKSVAAKAMGTQQIKSVDLVDDYTVRVTLSTWDNTVISYFAYNPGLMISPSAYDKNGEEWAIKNPVGTGPFKFVSKVTDVKTIFKKFDGYWQKGKPYVDGIEWAPIPEAVPRQLALRTSEIDICNNVSFEDRASLEKDGYIVKRMNLSLGATGPIIPDSANPNSPFANVKVRQAIAHAIDAKSIVTGLFRNEAEVTNQFSIAKSWAYNPSITGYPYDPAKSKQLLAEAGFPNGFKTTFFYFKSYENDLLAPSYQAFLKAVGIDLVVEPALPPRFDQVALQGGKWEGLINGIVSPIPDPVAALAGRYMGTNPKVFSQMLVPDDYRQMMMNSMTAADFEAKKKYFQEAVKLMIDKYCLWIPTYSNLDATVFAKYVHNSGWMDYPANTAQWTPEEVWMDK
jgi:peptide/nickel transport system substrate-binding protein